jgi:hypothetical protein
MRSLPVVLGSLFVLFGLELGCGGTSKVPVATAGTGQASAGAGDQGGSSGAGSGLGGSSAGEPTVGASAGSSGAPVGGSHAAGAGGTDGGEGGAPTLVDCDVKKITCKRAAPACDTFHVPSVEGSCYGDCVKIDRCACSGPDQCPDSNQYTCWSKTHCGPYVN